MLVTNWVSEPRMAGPMAANTYKRHVIGLCSGEMKVSMIDPSAALMYERKYWYES
jgi:hypothetical protein